VLRALVPAVPHAPVRCAGARRRLPLRLPAARGSRSSLKAAGSLLVTTCATGRAAPHFSLGRQSMAKLNDKQTCFCKEYLKDLNATKAAIRAGYSKKTAGSQAFDLLKKPEIQKLVTKLIQARSKRCQIDADQIILELKKQGFSTLRHYYRVTDTGSLSLDMWQVTDDQFDAIGEIERPTNTRMAAARMPGRSSGSSSSSPTSFGRSSSSASTSGSSRAAESRTRPSRCGSFGSITGQRYRRMYS
jgi:Terminase small subunit